MTPVLEITDVTFRRDGKQIIDGISLTVNEGEVVGLPTDGKDDRRDRRRHGDIGPDDQK